MSCSKSNSLQSEEMILPESLNTHESVGQYHTNWISNRYHFIHAKPSMGGNADDSHIGITVRYRVRKLNNFDQRLISSEILSHEHCETKLLEEALKASCVLCGPIPARFFSLVVFDLSVSLPLCIEGWASKSFVVYDKGKTPWHGNHGVDLVKVGEKNSSWLHFNSESALHLQSSDFKT